jgi:CRP-like cAMP-binding protein
LITELFLKGRLRQELSAAEKSVIEQSISRTITLGPRETFIDAGQRLENSYYLVEGQMLRYVDDPRGVRQLVHISVPGDFVDLHGYAMKRLDHDLGTLTECTLAEFPHEALSAMFAGSARLMRAMWFSTLLDASMHREWIRALNGLNSEARLAHLIAELVERMRLIGRFDGRALPIPLLQRDYANACGVSEVHCNRCFSNLRARGLITISRGGRLEVSDIEGLQQMAGFTGSYLYGGSSLDLDVMQDA